MSRTIKEARLNLYKPSNDTNDNYDEQVPGDDIASVIIDERAQAEIGVTSIELTNGREYEAVADDVESPQHALDFGAFESDYVDVGGRTFSDGYAIGATIKPESLGDPDAGGTSAVVEFSTSVPGGFNEMINIRLRTDGSIRVHIRDDGGNDIAYDSNFTLSVGEVYTVINSVDTANGRAYIYINGAEDRSVVYAGNTITTGAGSIGRTHDPRYFDGIIDNVFVADDHMDLDEASAYHENGAYPSSVVAQYDLDEGSGSIATDSAGTSDGTINGAEYVKPLVRRPPGITSGDRIEFITTMAGESDIGYGESYGTSYATGMTHQWTGVVRRPTDVFPDGYRHHIDIEAADFVFQVMAWRLVYDTFDGKPIAGSSNAILETVLSETAPEIGQTQIGTFSDTIDGFYNGRKLFDVVTEELAPFADAVAMQDDTDLVFERLSSISPKHSFTPSDVRGEVRVRDDDGGLQNVVRVDGGTDHAVDDQQETVDDTARVTASNRFVHQLEVRKSEIARVQVFVDKDDSSDDNLVVRLQADRNGAPVALSDSTSDIANRELAPEFLANSGFTTFIMPAHTFSPAANPWLIIEATGSTGHDVGYETLNGVPAYRAEYPFPLLSRNEDEDSVTAYRRREGRVKDESLRSLEATKARSASELRHGNEPDRVMTCEADSLRAHNLQPAEVVTMEDWVRGSISGDWVCTRRQMNYRSRDNRMTTRLTLQEASSV